MLILMGFEWDFDGIYFGIYLGAKLINITPITMVFYTHITIVFMGFLFTNYKYYKP